MARKGTTYAQISVDLQAWARSYLTKNGIIERGSQAALAKQLGVNKGRITDLLAGRLNTINMMEVIADKLPQEFKKMDRFAQDEAGLEAIRKYRLVKGQTPYEHDLYRKAANRLSVMVKCCPDGVEQIIREMEDLCEKCKGAGD